jgi:hypothetical protein
MRQVVMAAALAFSPRTGINKGALPKVTRHLAHFVLAYLDRRRKFIDAR